MKTSRGGRPPINSSPPLPPPSPPAPAFAVLRRSMGSTSWSLSAASLAHRPSPWPSRAPRKMAAAVGSLGSVSLGRCGCLFLPPYSILQRSRRRRNGAICMAPEEEKMTRRSPLDFPIEWERPKPSRRPDIFPQFSPMKTPLPTPLPEDPPEEDEEEEEEKNEEEEEDPEPQPDENSRMQHGGWF
ncbi:hypothetical protein MUK42_13445 [Musa troglodytarum]|uniref:Uncharacterized protein n=1 Tax=Musa troglodytarum TaxID=320322 RepID=A0A9E7I1E0_9LILI|nr:hypothetical protein MUK42_13445 [Musa troglodytarum]